MVGLVEGLTVVVVAIRILARVPFYIHLKLEVVCRSWKAAVRSPELSKYDKKLFHLRIFWITLPVLPSKIRHLAHYGVASISGKLFVIYGGSDVVDPPTGDHDGCFATDKVWSYDSIEFTNCRKTIPQAEIYDPEKDFWSPILDLHRNHNSSYSGIVIGGKRNVLHQEMSTVQVLDNAGASWDQTDADLPFISCQDPVTLLTGITFATKSSPETGIFFPRSFAHSIMETEKSM
ncbi:hypothetical protein KIW84_066586 [Lathyrus oleraceus]|uniref:F-box domain-containing protein n=1 Tax=Pisum sativum TaxID=3888 RepID=A0A9D4WG69_PEA|nr:hypothetical protein KIW84_066586 [Pisum sativum]